MSAKTTAPRTCDECRYDGGWHWTEDLEPRAYRCPNWTIAEAQEQAAAAAVEHQAKHADHVKQAARQILADAAHRFYEFSSNEIADEIAAAQLPGSAIGPAFNWAKDEGLIVGTDRFVMSRKGTTRHRVQVWRSRDRRWAAISGEAS